ncbi:MAG: hypothetical protein R3E50_05590 [Halioglobus sp.]
MSVRFDRIVLAVPELQSAVAEYECLLGASPFLCDSFQGAPAAWWGLSNTVIELTQAGVQRPCLQGIVLAAAGAETGEKPVANSLGVDIRLSNGQDTSDYRRLQGGSRCADIAVDHLVLRTGNAQGCIALFNRELGIRLALDKTVPEWGGRMLFFRAGKLTLEVIESQVSDAVSSYFWGLAYQYRNLAEAVRILGKQGVAVSEIRKGRKPGTLVATLQSHCLEIPTLLIQPAR